MESKRYRVITLGCRTNQYESQAYVDQLKAKGYSKASDGEKAEVCIVNTCTVTESADKRSRYQIRKLAREYAPKHLIITGCLAERDAVGLKNIPGVTNVVSNTEKTELLEKVFPEENWPEFKIENFEAHTRAFVKIQDGCNSYCSYCVIPFVRGRSRSRSIEEIVKEVEGLVTQGYKEVVLTGINIGDFDGGNETPGALSKLVRVLDVLEGLSRIRISSIDPDEVDDELLDAVISGKKTCHSMHIVLQAGSNLTLKRMRRKYTKQDFLKTTKRLLEASPTFTFTTDIIVGFPGETEEEFEETLNLVKETQFAKVHMFPYSDRPKTRASRMPNKVPLSIIHERKERLLKIAEDVALKKRDPYIGSEVEVLLESEEKMHPGFLMGHTTNFLPVLVPKEGLRSNDIVTVKCHSNSNEGLIAHVH